MDKLVKAVGLILIPLLILLDEVEGGGEDHKGRVPLSHSNGLECLHDPISAAPSNWLANSSSRTVGSYPGFHGYVASTPNKTLPDGSVIIQNPVWSKTIDWDWQGWESCPKGMYGRGIQHYNIMSSNSVYFFDLTCQSPGGNENRHVQLKKVSHFRPDDAGLISHICTGTIVGFQLKKKSNINAVTAVRVHCSTNVPLKTVHLTGRKKAPVDPEWTDSRYCGKYQAICALRITYLDNPTPEYNGMHNMEARCCHVPDPWKDCVPTEQRLLIRTCDNSASDKGLRCVFERRIGIGLFANGEKEEKENIFYSSIGYDFASISEQMKEKIISKLASKTGEYNWKEVNCRAEADEMVTLDRLCVKPKETVRLYQIVGRCGNFIVRTNRFVKVVDGSVGSREEYFDL